MEVFLKSTAWPGQRTDRKGDERPQRGKSATTLATAEPAARPAAQPHAQMPSGGKVGNCLQASGNSCFSPHDTSEAFQWLPDHDRDHRASEQSS